MIGTMMVSFVKFVVSTSVGVVVTNVVRHTTPIVMKASEKVFVQVGTYVVTHMIADKAADYVETQIKESVAKLFPKKQSSEEK